MNIYVIFVIVHTVIFIAFMTWSIMMAEETHYNKLVKLKPVTITSKKKIAEKGEQVYCFEVTRHEKISEDTYRGPRVHYKNKLDGYTIKVSKETYDKFEEGDYVSIVAKRKDSYVKLHVRDSNL